MNYLKRWIAIMALVAMVAPAPLQVYAQELPPVEQDPIVVEETVSNEPADDQSLTGSRLLNEKILNNDENFDKNTAQFNEGPRKDFVEGEVIVKFKESAINLKRGNNGAKSLQFAESRNLDKKEDIRGGNISVLKARKDKSGKSETVEQMVERLKNDPSVEYVEPNYYRYPQAIDTTDTLRGELWGLDNTGQTINGSYGNITGTIDKDIDAPEAWAINEGTNADIIVAVIDSGVAYNHPDLLANMWDGSACKDEVGNALGGCNHGYDFASGDKTPLPDLDSHGTHVAGTIGAVKNNGRGIIGVAPNVKIMALKVDIAGGLSSAAIISAIDFAIQNGAQVINASYVGSSFSQAEYDAIERFRIAGGLFVAAAGNGGSDQISDDNETAHLYPSDYDLGNIISVAATDQHDALASFSNFGATSVDVGAPGTNILSTVINVSSTVVLNETFEGVTSPNNPAGWTATGDWGTYDLDGGTFWGKVLYGDVVNSPYAQSANSTITSSVYDLSNSTAIIDFWTRCDTEYSLVSWTDYMALEFSSNGGSTYAEVLKWDEPYIDGDSDPSGNATYHFQNLNIPSQYETSNFKFRLRWVANGNADTGSTGDGCLVDDIKITKYADKDGTDELYDYYDGTSMATPHVAGLAALIWGYNSGLTAVQLKNAILTTGDPIADLHPTTGTHPISTGKRINAYSALQSVNPAKAITSFDFAGLVPPVTGVVNEGAKTVTLTVPSGTDVTALVPTIVITGESISPLSGVAQNFTNPVTYTVTAADTSTQDYVVTVIVDSTAPIISENTAVTTPTTDSTPDVIITSDEAGTITVAGGCDSATTNAIAGNTTITLDSDGAGAPLADGTYAGCTVTVTDSVGNVSNTLTLTSFTVDTSAPSVTVNQKVGQADPTNVSPALFTAVFSEPIDAATFTNTDITIAGTATTGVVVLTEVAPNDGTTFEISVPVTADGTIIASIGAGLIDDLAGNSNTASTSTDNSITVNTSAPSVTVNQKVGQADPTNVSPALFTAVFSEPIDAATFTNTDITIAGTATTGVVVLTEVAPNDGTTFEISVPVTADGTVVASIGAGLIDDLAGNGNTASTSTDNSITVDTTAPSVTVNQKAGQADPTNVSPVLFTVVFSEPIDAATFTNTDITIAGTATTGVVVLSEVAPNDGTIFEISVPVTADGTVVASIGAGLILDLAGNSNTASTSNDNSITIDTSAPIISENTAVTTPTTDSTPDVIITSDEAGTITVAGGCDSATTNAIAGNTTITLDSDGAGAPLADGTYAGCTVTVTDSAGNVSNTLTLTSFTIDASAPSVTVNQKVGQADPTNVSPVLFTAIFSEPIDVATFTNADITIAGTATTGTVALTEVAPNDGTIFEISVPVTADGTVVASIGAGLIDDLAGNSNTASTSNDNSITYDTTSPVVTTYSPADGATGVAIAANLVLTFNENVRAVVGGGNIDIRKSSDDSLVESIAIDGALVTFNGTTKVTVNPSVTLLNSTEYYVQIDATAIEDVVGIDFVGIADTTTWNFTTVAVAPSGGGGGGGGGGCFAPTGTISINAGATATATRTVTLNLTSTNATEVIVSENELFTGASYQAVSSTLAFTLSEGEGTKTVYAKFRGSCGTSTQVFDTIVYDTSATEQKQQSENILQQPQQETVVVQDPEPAPALSQEVQAVTGVGELVKRPDLSAVYFIDQDNRRHAFPNEDVYFSWFSDFSQVKTISADILAQIPLGSNVTMRPGTNLVKIATLPHVYAVEPYGVLRWVSSRAVAESLYGLNWENRINIVPDTFFVNYQMGSDITANAHPTGSLIRYLGEQQVYLVADGVKHPVSASVFVIDLFQDKFISFDMSSNLSYPTGNAYPILPWETLMAIR